MSPEPASTVSACCRQMAADLAAGGVETPLLEARLLLARVLGCTRADLLSRGGDPLSPVEAEAARALVRRRLAGEPVARILGHREFWSLDLALSPDTLVPRPDTETVVEAALAAFPFVDAALRILDLGVGSGAILAALLSERPNAFGVGVDRSEGAARTTCDNLAHAGLRARSAVLVGDWAEALAGGFGLDGGFDLVVSNPPYIPRADIAHLQAEVRQHDPLLALDGGEDGLSAYRTIVAELPRLLRRDGIAVLELGAGQEPEVAALACAAGLEVVGPARRDLAGIARALTLRRC